MLGLFSISKFKTEYNRAMQCEGDYYHTQYNVDTLRITFLQSLGLYQLFDYTPTKILFGNSRIPVRRLVMF